MRRALSRKYAMRSWRSGTRKLRIGPGFFSQRTFAGNGPDFDFGAVGQTGTFPGDGDGCVEIVDPEQETAADGLLEFRLDAHRSAEGSGDHGSIRTPQRVAKPQRQRMAAKRHRRRRGEGKRETFFFLF